MTRTKIRKHNTKQNNIDECASKMQALNQCTESYIEECKMRFEQQIEHMDNKIKNIKLKLSKNILNMNLKEYNQIMENPDLYNVNDSQKTNFTSHSTLHSSAILSEKSRDDGYNTENSSSIKLGGRPIGPLMPAISNKRRSRSVYGNESSTLRKNLPKNIKSIRHSSRSIYKTPHRLQTMSADRLMVPVTPKIQPNIPVAMLRYPKLGETVISLSGSPVIVQGVVQDSANINIPILNGVFSLQPSVMSEVDSELISSIDNDTLRQLKQLQSNLNVIMSYVGRK